MLSTLWAANIRNIALVTCIVSVLSLLTPTWNLVQTMVGIGSRHAESGWWLIPIAVFSVLSSAILPVFFLALYRNEGMWRIPKPLRKLSVASAIFLGLFVVAALRVESLDPYFIGRGGLADRARLVSHISSLVNAFSDASLLFLLTSFFRLCARIWRAGFS